MSSKNKLPEETLFTPREIQFLLALQKYEAINNTALELKISYRRAAAIKANIQRKWKLAVNSNNYMLALTKRHEGFKKLMLSVGRSKLQVQEEEWTDREFAEEEENLEEEERVE